MYRSQFNHQASSQGYARQENLKILKDLAETSPDAFKNLYECCKNDKKGLNGTTIAACDGTGIIVNETISDVFKTILLDRFEITEYGDIKSKKIASLQNNTSSAISSIVCCVAFYIACLPLAYWMEGPAKES